MAVGFVLYTSFAFFVSSMCFASVALLMSGPLLFAFASFVVEGTPDSCQSQLFIIYMRLRTYFGRRMSTIRLSPPSSATLQASC
jgi:hypothetical protein